MRQAEGNTDTEPDSFSYELSRGDGRAVLSLSGELDLASATELSDCLQRLADSHVPTIVVDLAELKFCDSSGLGVLLRSHEQAKGLGIRLVLRSPTPNVSRVFELTNTARLFEVDSE